MKINYQDFFPFFFWRWNLQTLSQVTVLWIVSVMWAALDYHGFWCPSSKQQEINKNICLFEFQESCNNFNRNPTNCLFYCFLLLMMKLLSEKALHQILAESFLSGVRGFSWWVFLPQFKNLIYRRIADSKWSFKLQSTAAYYTRSFGIF